MTSVYINCPKCEDEFEFVMQFHSADDGFHPVCEERKQNCDCPFSDDELDAFEQQAIEKFCEM